MLRDNVWSVLTDEEKDIFKRFGILTIRKGILVNAKNMYMPVTADDLKLDKLRYEHVKVDLKDTNMTVVSMIDDWIKEIDKELMEIKIQSAGIFQNVLAEGIIQSYKETLTELDDIDDRYNSRLIEEFLRINGDSGRINISDSTKPFIMEILNLYSEFMFNTFSEKRKDKKKEDEDSAE